MEQATNPLPDSNPVIDERREKLKALREAGNAYPNDFDRTDLAGALTESYASLEREALESAGTKVRIAGRMMLKRVMGKASFATLQDMSGRIQIYVTEGDLGKDAHDAFKHWDIGDIVGAEGALFKTKMGELTVRATSVRLLTKSLRPLPEKFHGLTDQEMRYRQRYVDLIMSDDTRSTFRKRTRIIQSLRNFLVDRDFLEV